MPEDRLSRYRAKRDFERTGEPDGSDGRSGGAGAVIVWDTGSYRMIHAEETPAEARERGHLSVWLEGEKLRGGSTLRRTRGGDKPQWLLVKRRDEAADARRDLVSTQPESVLSGRTVDDVAAEGG